MKTDQWHSCYNEGWGDDIVPGAFSHPAKASKALIFRILEHCLDQGWIQSGATLTVSNELIDYLQCQSEFTLVQIAEKALVTPDASNAPDVQPEMKKSRNDQRQNARLVATPLRSSQASLKSIARHDASTRKTEHQKQSHAQPAELEFELQYEAEANTAPNAVTENPSLATNTKKEKAPTILRSGQKATQDAQAKTTGNGGVVSENSITESHGKNSAETSEMDSENAKHVAIKKSSKSTIKSHTDIAEVTPSRTSRSCVLSVTARLIEILTGPCRLSSLNGNNKWLSERKSITLILQIPLNVGDTSSVVADTVLDPFGGVGTSALPCLLRGINVVTCELEPKFFDLQEQNATLWQRRYGNWPAFQKARWLRLNGDSRNLERLITKAHAVVSSPPYADSLNHERCGIDFTKCKKDYPGRVMHEERVKGHQAHHKDRLYGRTEGQLGGMKEGQLDAAISSPPFTQTHGGGKGINVDGYDGRDRNEKVGDRTYQGINADRSPDNLETMKEGDVDMAVSSPPFISARQDTTASQNKKPGPCSERLHTVADANRYGKTEGQMGDMKEGDVHLAMSSPPYAAIATGAGGLNSKPATKPGQQQGRSAKSASQDTHQKYGDSNGQLAAMPDHGFDAAVTSPPYETGGHHDHQMDAWNKNGRGQPGQDPGYADQSDGQLTKDTFWIAARAILQQTFDLLKPGGHAIWITKNFVKAKKEVDFNDNWRRLCHSVGFKTVCVHHAMLVESRGTNLLLDGGEHTETRARKSFFRRLAESKGSPPIDFECVTCMVKPR